MKISLGSTSTHKLQAIEDACSKLGITAEISGFKTDSGINEQPVGFEETYDGALKRALGAKDNSSDAYALGIESGIMYLSQAVSRAIDMAVIVLIKPDGTVITSNSTGVIFPESYVEEANLRGFDTTTVGSIVTEKLGGDPTDPHSVLTNGKVTRTMTLIDGLVTALRQI